MTIKKKTLQDRINHYERTEQKYTRIVNDIKGLYDTADSLDEHNPDDILYKAEIYGMILEKVGDLHYISIQAFKYADALKKETKAIAVMEDREGRTVEQHRERAVLQSQEWRWTMAEWEGLTKRWENAKDSIEEQIKIMKWKVKWELANRSAQGIGTGQA